MTQDAPPPGRPGLRALVVDDEAPALAELAFLLRADPRVAEVRTASGATEALRCLDEVGVDVVFCDVKMPGLDGLELARVLARFARRPQVVFVTAHEGHAVDAFELAATDYVMKPVREARLAEAVRRVAEGARGGGPADLVLRDGPAAGDDDVTIPVELGGVTRFVPRGEVRWVEAQGDYARLHTREGSHLLRVALTALEDRWGPAGFVRVHRSTLVSLAHVDEVRVDGGRCEIRLGDVVLQVSRRHTRELRDRLVRATALSRATR